MFPRSQKEFLIRSILYERKGNSIRFDTDKGFIQHAPPPFRRIHAVSGAT